MKKGWGLLGVLMALCFLSALCLSRPLVQAEGTQAAGTALTEPSQTTSAIDTSLNGLYKQKDGRVFYLLQGIHQTDFTGFAKNDKGQFCYIVKGIFQNAKTGYVKRASDDKWVYLKKGVLLSDFYGVKTTGPGVEAYLTAGVWDREVNGLKLRSSDGKLLYVKQGIWQKNFTGLAENEKGQSCYVVKGVFQSGKTGYVKRTTDDRWVYLKNGIIVSDFYGVKTTAPGIEAYLSAGVWNRDVSGLKPQSSDGKLLYVKNGIWQKNFTGFANNDKGQSCYVVKGVFQSGKTGYVKRDTDSRWVYLKNGIILSSFNGVKTTTPGVEAYLTAGVWDRDVSGLKPRSSDGKLLYVKKGVWQKDFTGLVKNDKGQSCYVKKGIWQSAFTGIYKDSNNQRYYCRDGIKNTSFTGQVTQGGYVYQVTAGKVGSPKKYTLQVETKQKVILITIDGMRPDAVQKCGNAFAKELPQKSAYTLKGQTVYPSYTLPVHYALFHSADPYRTGITENYYKTPKEAVLGLVEHLRASGMHCAMYYSWETLKHIANPADLRATGFIDGTASASVKADEQLTQMALNYIQNSHPDFLFLYLLDTDEWGGHVHGWMSKAYLNKLSDAFNCVKRIWEAVGSEYTILVFSDHGGHDYGHGSDSAADMTVPFFALGPDFAGGTLFQSYSVLDVAPTVSELMGLAPDKAWSGTSLLK